MIKIWIDENNQKVSKVLNNKELQLLKKINIDENLLLSDASSRIMRYLIEKYNLIVLSDITEQKITDYDKDIYNIYNKINNYMDRLT